MTSHFWTALATTLVAVAITAGPAAATPTAVVSIACEGTSAVATFVYTSNANNMTAAQTLTVDGTRQVRFVPFGSGGLTDQMSATLPRDGKLHDIMASTSVTGTNGQTAEASDSVTCRTPKPPPQPCKVNCGPPPPPCQEGCAPVPPPPPPDECGGKLSGDQDPDCKELPYTGTHWFETNGFMAGLSGLLGLAFVAGGLALRRQRG